MDLKMPVSLIPPFPTQTHHARHGSALHAPWKWIASQYHAVHSQGNLDERASVVHGHWAKRWKLTDLQKNLAKSRRNINMLRFSSSASSYDVYFVSCNNIQKWLCTLLGAHTRACIGYVHVYNVYTDKNKIKFSSYIRKFRLEQLQSHIWGRASLYMRKCANISHIRGGR